MESSMRSEVEPELLLHATQELNHAVLLVNRIIQLGGAPIINPADWTKHAMCACEAPDDPSIEVVLEQNFRGEQCAIEQENTIDEMVDFYHEN